MPHEKKGVTLQKGEDGAQETRGPTHAALARGDPRATSGGQYRVTSVTQGADTLRLLSSSPCRAGPSGKPWSVSPGPRLCSAWFMGHYEILHSPNALPGSAEDTHPANNRPDLPQAGGRHVSPEAGQGPHGPKPDFCTSPGTHCSPLASDSGGPSASQDFLMTLTTGFPRRGSWQLKPERDCLGCPIDAPQTGWLETTEIYPHTVLKPEVRNQVPAGPRSLRSSGRQSVHPSSWLLVWLASPGVPALQTHQSSCGLSHHMASSLVCLCLLFL